MKVRPWMTMSRNVVLNRAPWLTVEDHRVRLPTGEEISDWSWIIALDYVTVAATTEENAFLCFRQTKYAVEGVTLAPVAGYLKPGEAPLAGAQQELRKETGYEATSWLELGSYVVDANRGAGRGHFFLAGGARPTSLAIADDLEDQHLLLFSREEIEEALDRGEFKVMSWVATFALALRRIDQTDSSAG